MAPHYLSFRRGLCRTFPLLSSFTDGSASVTRSLHISLPLRHVTNSYFDRFAAGKKGVVGLRPVPRRVPSCGGIDAVVAVAAASSLLPTGAIPCVSGSGRAIGLFRPSDVRYAYHYIHPKTSRPIRQFRKYGDPRYINNEVAVIQGLFGLITTDFGMVTQTQLESARLAILRRIPRGAFTLVMHTDYEEFPVVKKSPESRMGAGKSNIHHFAFKFTTGIPLFEIHGTGSRRLNLAEAEGIFLAGRSFIPLQTAVVPRGRVDEYHVFK